MLDNNTGAQLNNSGFIVNNKDAHLIFRMGSHFGNTGGTLRNSGTISSYIDNLYFGEGGIFLLQAGSHFINYADFFTKTGSTTNNNETVSNKGKLEVSGTFDNDGILNNEADGMLSNSGSFINAKMLNNNSALTNQSGGVVANEGTLNNNSGGSFNNHGTLNNGSGSTLNLNKGSSFNNSGGMVNNSGVINSHIDELYVELHKPKRTFNANGTFVNYATITYETGMNALITENYGTLDNRGSLIVNGGMTNTQYGRLINNNGLTITQKNSTLFNQGGLINNSDLTCHGVIENNGALTNSEGAEFSLSRGASLDVYNPGSLSNKGIMNLLGRLTVSLGSNLTVSSKGVVNSYYSDNWTRRGREGGGIG